MKNIYYKLFTFVCLLFMTAGAFAQPGVIDQSFGSNGKVRVPITIGDRVHPVDLKLQPDNKILVLVTADTGYSGVDVETFFKYQLFRFNPDGTPDNTFGTNGSTPVVDRERPTGMELLANGQIILNTARFDGRSTLTWPYYDSINLCLTRYNSNGTVDNTFGTNGRTVSPIGNTQTVANGLIVLPNGKMIQSGISYVSRFVSIPAPAYTVLLGFDQNGNIDPSFGTNGIVKVRIMQGLTVDYYYAIASEFNHHVSCLMQSNQRLVVPADSGMYRFNSNGALDPTFGTNGYAMYPPGYMVGVSPSTSWKLTQSPAFAGLVEPNDKIMLVKHTTPDSTISYSQYPVMACRFNANGSPDTTFPNFMINPDNGTGFTLGRNSAEIFLEPNGQYTIAIGYCYGCSAGSAYTEIIKLNSNGTADSMYGKRGRIVVGTYGFPKDYRFGIMGNAAAVQADGKLVIAGVVDTSLQGWPSQKAWVVTRFEKNGRLKYNTLVADVFHDENANGIKDGNETAFTGWYSVNTVKPGRTDTMRWVSQQYPYKPDLHDVDTGTYRSSVILYNMSYYTVVPVVRITSHSTYWNTDTLSFAVQPVPNIRDLAITLTTLGKAKPGFPVSYLVKVHNEGTDSAGNLVVKLIKDNKVAYDSATIAATSVVGDTITWNMGGLQSLHDAFIIVYGKVKAPPVANVGEGLLSTAFVSSDKTDTLSTNDSSFLWQPVFGAFDPNDKAENHGGKIALSKAAAGEYLTYTIRFQNTGNDTAFNVYIRDTMDSKLDWNSLQIVASSHNYKMTMNDGKCLFTFPFIMLVDSLHNEAKSHGYIVYKIKAKPNVQLGDVIKNTAHIYFDYNLPITTNTEITTVMADMLPLKLLSFTAKKDGKTNLLQWTTANEINVDRFEVERSFDGREFAKIGSVKATGADNYSYTDNNPATTLNPNPQTTFYRLKMLDKDGQFTYSPIKVISNNSPFSVSIYPNPAKDKLQLQIESEKSTALQLQVLSLDGKVLLSNSFSAAEGASLRSINIGALQKGSYLLKLSSADSNEETVVRFEKR